MQENVKSKIETLLFIAQRPLTIKKIAELIKSTPHDVKEALEPLSADYAGGARGIVLILHNESAEFATSPENAPIVKEYTNDESSGELTRAGLETLTIIAYRGPMTKSAIEQIRGVNCTIVLRNLAIRGYIEAMGDERSEKMYSASFDFLRHLGIASVSDLPDYALLHSDERLESIPE